MSSDSDSHRLALPAGYQLEEYRIERVLGKGGFGITYLARDTNLHNRVAVKEMLPDGIATRVGGHTVVAQTKALEDDFRWALTRFIDEARVLASLSHPNIVPVLRLIEANGTAYMIMAFVEGESLTQWFLKHPKPTEDELNGILMPLLEGLDYLHKRKLLHRDIKPDNIFLTGESKPVLLDFGNVRQEIGRTMTMTTVVSDGYSPFEQYQQRANQGGYTDLYALAAVMARAVLGVKPPNAPDRVSNDGLLPSLEKVGRGRYSTAFLRALDRALALWSKDRPQSVAEFRALLAGDGAGPYPRAAGTPLKREDDDEDRTEKAKRSDSAARPGVAGSNQWKILGSIGGVLAMAVIIYLSSPKPVPKPDPEPNPNPGPDIVTTDPKPDPGPSGDDPSTGKLEKEIDKRKGKEPGPGPKKSGQWIVDARGGNDADGTDLATVVERAGEGETVLVRPGIYTGGITLVRPVRITGDTKSGGQAIIRAGRDGCVDVRSKGVILENLELELDAQNAAAAVSAAGNATVEMNDCRVQSGSARGISVRESAAVTAGKCKFSGNAGFAAQLEDQARGQFTECLFTGNLGCVIAMGEAQAGFKTCNFQNNGPSNGKGTVLGVSGEKARITADNCGFTGNTSGIAVDERGSLMLTQCRFTDNGITGAPGAWTQGFIAVRNKAQATLTDGTFNSNRQGIAVTNGGTVEMTGCRFTACGMDTKTPAVALFCTPLYVTGGGSTATVRGGGFEQSVQNAIRIADGGALTLENCDVNASGDTGLAVGLPKSAPGRAEVKKGRFAGNQRAVEITSGGSATFETSEFRQNGVALAVLDAGSSVRLADSIISENRELGLFVHTGASLTAMDCTIEKNMRGVQSGMPGKSSAKAVAALENCKLLSNQLFDANACQQSRITLTNCTYAAEGKPKIVREQSGIVQADPAVNVTIANNAPPKSKPSSNNPQPRPQPGPDSVNQAIDAINRLRGLIRR